MFSKIVLFFAFSAVILSAQTSTTYGNLIRIPFDAVQIDPADTMGSWESALNSFSQYEDVIHTPQKTYFEKLSMSNNPIYPFTELTLEDFINQTSDTYGSWIGEYDVPEPYILIKTQPFFIGNGTWLINGVHNMAFLSNDDKITLIPKEGVHDLVYICGKINDKYLIVYKKEASGLAYDFYLADLSTSPDIDTMIAEKMFFDRNIAPYKMKHLFDSLYLTIEDSLFSNYPNSFEIYNLQGTTFYYQKNLNGMPQYIDDWDYNDSVLFIYSSHNLYKFSLVQGDTSFIQTLVTPIGNQFARNHNFSCFTYIQNDSLFVFNNDINNPPQLINAVDIVSLRNPGGPIVDSPYVYLHQTTYFTDVKDKPEKPLSYKLQIYPNPFNPSANLEYTIPERAVVRIKLFDVLGSEVREIFNGESEAGTHRIKIDGKDLSSGIYFVNFVSEKYVVTKKIVMLK
ncbi:MAG TPA: T9SS type A sorting domain-containing protein [Ignavibacteriaceae bacterium]|nr:T9SS type A sorting domain-containing protein [Ignavibacteriaceae bacterium]